MFYCQKSEWNSNRCEFRKGTEEYVQRNDALEKMKSRAEKIFSDAFSEGEDLSLDEFETSFNNYYNNLKSVDAQHKALKDAVNK